MEKYGQNSFTRQAYIRLLLIQIVLLSAACTADTFQHKTSGQIYHGYATQIIVNGMTTVMTAESGKLVLNLSEYNITQDSQGRNNTISVITIEGPIESQFAIDSIEQSIIDESNKGPRLIIIELDSPGGRIDLAIRLCSRLMQTTNCPTAAYVKSDTFGGAYSAAAAIALACNKLYINSGTAIGATTAVAKLPTGQIASLSEVAGEDVSAKIHSVWKNFTASLAEKNSRPIAVVNGMEDSSIVILKVKRDNKIIYIEDTDKKETDTTLDTFKKKGEVLTLTAQTALECGIADKVVSSVQDILTDSKTQDATITQANSIANTMEEFKKIVRKFNDIYASVNAQKGSMEQVGTLPQERSRKLKDMLKDINYLIKMKEKYPEIPNPQLNGRMSLNDNNFDPLNYLKTEMEKKYEEAKMEQKKAIHNSRPGMPGTQNPNSGYRRRL